MSNKIENPENGPQKKNLKRRDVLKSLATIPIVGAVLYGALRKKEYDRFVGKNISAQVGMSHDMPPAIPPSNTSKNNQDRAYRSRYQGKTASQRTWFCASHHDQRLEKRGIGKRRRQTL